MGRVYAGRVNRTLTRMEDSVSLLDRFGLPALPAVFTIVVTILVAPTAHTQNPQLQEHIAEIKHSLAQNKQALSQYTWQEQQTISIKGEVKKQETFLVRIGPDGKQQKTEIGAPDASSNDERRLGHRIKERKKEEYEDYGKRIADLAQGYVQPEPGQLQQLYEQGNITLGSAGTPGELRIVIRNYLKQGDSVTLIYNKPQRMIQSIQISSYLSDPSDAVNISAQSDKLPNGINHVYDVLVNGISKQLTVEMQNSKYQHP
jgi:hypothetical protein